MCNLFNIAKIKLANCHRQGDLLFCSESIPGERIVCANCNHTRTENSYTREPITGEHCIYCGFEFLSKTIPAVELHPEETSVDRPWGKGDNPFTAIHKYLKENKSFTIDTYYQDKCLLTVAPDGFLLKH